MKNPSNLQVVTETGRLDHFFGTSFSKSSDTDNPVWLQGADGCFEMGVTGGEQRLSLLHRQLVWSQVFSGFTHENEGAIVNDEVIGEKGFWGDELLLEIAPKTTATDFRTRAAETFNAALGVLRLRFSNGTLKPQPVPSCSDLAKRNTRLRHPERTGVHAQQKRLLLSCSKATNVLHVNSTSVRKWVVGELNRRCELQGVAGHREGFDRLKDRFRSLFISEFCHGCRRLLCCHIRSIAEAQSIMNPQDIDFQIILETARDAGQAILEVYGTDDFQIESKDDDSPLTAADRNANAVIVAALEKHFPEIPIISEEIKALDYADRKDWDLFWMVDPLDGTKEFIKRNGEFTVNIALCQGQAPIAGVVHRPVDDTTYYATPGQAAFKTIGSGAPQPLTPTAHYSEVDDVIVVASRSHMSDAVTEFVEKLRAEGKNVEFLSAGSSLKLCLVAEGAATVYPRLGPTMEWDTAAAHAVAFAAGKKVLNAETMEPLIYNKEDLLNPWFFVE